MVDVSDSCYKDQMRTTKDTLTELNAGDIPVITVFNKADKCEETVTYPQIVGSDKIYLSAREESSIYMLTDMILEKIYADYITTEFLIPYHEGSVISYFMDHTHVINKEYQESGAHITVKCHRADKEKYAEYMV